MTTEDRFETMEEAEEFARSLSMTDKRVLEVAIGNVRGEWVREWLKWTKTATSDEIKEAQKQNAEQNDEAIRKIRA